MIQTGTEVQTNRSSHSQGQLQGGFQGELQGKLQGTWPLSAAQQGIWLGQQLDPHSPCYNTAECVEICGYLDPVIFERSLRQMVTEAETLHLRFDRHRSMTEGQSQTIADHHNEENPIQYLDLDSSSDWCLHSVDLSTTPNPKQATWEWMHRDLHQQVNLNTDKLFAQALLRVAPDCFFWYQRIHHIAIDGYGCTLLLQRVAEIYTAITQGKAMPPSPFASLEAVLAEDFAYQTSEQKGRDRAYWLDVLADAPNPVSLSQTDPGLSSVTATGTFCLRQSDVLSSEQFDRLQTVARSLCASWSDLLLATTALYLHQATGARDLILGVPMMGRLGSAALRVPAMVMNIVPLRLVISADTEFPDLVGQIGQRLRTLRPHHRYRYEQLRRDLKRVGGGRRLFGPIVNIMPFDNTLRFGDAPGILHNVSAGPVEDLAFNIRVGAVGQMLKLDLDGHPACYAAQDLAHHLQQWLAVLSKTLDHLDGQSPVTDHQVPIIEPETNFAIPAAAISRQTEQTEFGIRNSETPVSVIWGEPIESPRQLVLDRLQEQVRLHPHTKAVESAGWSLSYSELWQLVQDFGSRLVAAGIEPEQIVAIHLPRSGAAIVAILGILFSGAAYLALDPEAPIARNASLLKDARPVLLITQPDRQLQSLADLPPQLLLNSLLPTNVVQAIAQHQPSPQETVPLKQIRDNTLAYMVYTSGSTGQPKGVMIEHLALASFVRGAVQRYGIRPGDRVLQFAALHFDASVEEIFVTLCSGATLVLREEAMLQSIPHFLQACQEKQITVLDLPTAFWHELTFCLAHRQETLLPSLRMVIIGGEAAHPERVKQWHTIVNRHPNTVEVTTDKEATREVILLNTYGPSETTVVATAATVAILDSEQEVSIGRPLPGVVVAVLDSARNPVAVGERGELYILGPTLARGYWGQDQLSVDRFVPLNHFPGQPRAYRTGDQVYLRPDGQLIFVGRLDTQFKISGHRIDPAEIEAVLTTIPGIREAAVVGYTLPEGIKRLGAYLVAETPHPSVQTLRRHLTQVLPIAVVPGGFNFVDALPKTSAGKVDRSRLKQLTPTWLTEHQTTSISPLEALILQAWSTLLGHQGLTVQDDFFEWGGQSLQLIQVANWLSAKLNRDIPIATLFRYPTAATLAMALNHDGLQLDFGHSPVASPQPAASLTLFSPLLPITENQHPPLFCLHPAAGISWCYLGLAKHLSSQYSLYGLQSPDNVAKANVAQASWSARINQDLALIRQVQPQGPYRLLGWSVGGLIAHGMATQLQHQGEEVASLILLDAYPSHCFSTRDKPDQQEILTMLLQGTGQELTDIDRLQLDTLLAITQANIELARYAPTPDRYHGDLLFFTATQRPTNARTYPQNPLTPLTHQAWQPFVTGEIVNHNLDVEHGQILKGECLATIAEAIVAHYKGHTKENFSH
jgi:nonribosomal peptide synthetase MxcG